MAVGVANAEGAPAAKIAISSAAKTLLWLVMLLSSSFSLNAHGGLKP
jgi:hypothetical protein